MNMLLRELVKLEPFPMALGLMVLVGGGHSYFWITRARNPDERRYRLRVCISAWPLLLALLFLIRQIDLGDLHWAWLVGGLAMECVFIGLLMWWATDYGKHIPSDEP